MSLEVTPSVTEDVTEDYSVKRFNFDRPDPLLYKIVEYPDKGKPTLNRNHIIRYLRAHRIVYWNNAPYIFNGCIYCKTDEDFIKRTIHNAVDSYDLPPFLSDNTVRDIIAKFRVTNTPLDVEIPPEWDPDGNYDAELIPFRNGLYNVENGRLLPFTPFLFITRQLNVMYDPRIVSNPVEKIYNNIIPNEATRRFFYEMVGYSLFSTKMSPPAIFLIYGPGNTGKSALQEAVVSCAGRENVATLDIAQISGDFTTAEMLNKLINICGETGSGQSREISKADGELLKRLSDGQEITVQRKYGQPFQMYNTAKLWFVSNTLPDFGDTSSGLYRRLYIIPCRVEQKWEEQIYNKMQTEDAKTWLINKALKAYSEFIQDGRTFHTGEEMASERLSYKVQDSIQDFLEQEVGKTDKNAIAEYLDCTWVGDIYEAYRYYVVSTGGKPFSSRKFTEKIRNEFSMETERVHTTQLNGAPTYRVRFLKKNTPATLSQGTVL